MDPNGHAASQTGGASSSSHSEEAVVGNGTSSIPKPGTPSLSETFKAPLNPTIFETFEEEFDLTLLVGTSPTAQFRVDSRTMKRACKAWRVMLFGDFAEKRPQFGKWVVTFPEDDYQCFRIALHLIHGDALMVPKEPPLDTLYRLLKFIDKWDLFHHLEPWCKPWGDWLRRSSRNANFDWSEGRPLYIAWALGLEHLVDTILSKLIRHSYYDKDSQFKLCFDKNAAFKFDEYSDSTKFIDAVKSARKAILNKYMRIWNGICVELLQEKLTCQQPGVTDDIRRLCQRSLLGSLHQGFQREGLPLRWLLLNEGSDVARSLFDTESALLRVHLRTLRRIHIPGHSQAPCNPTDMLHSQTKSCLDVKAGEFLVTSALPTFKKELNQQRENWTTK